MSDYRGPDRQPGRQAGWPDAATAERLLRGTDTPDPADRRAAALAGLLAAASAPADLDPAREAAAVAAFRAARDEGALTAGGRDRGRADDWRPGGLRHLARSAKAVTGALIATVALGGVAVAAAVGALPIPFGGGASGPAPVHSGSGARPGSTGPGPSASASAPDRERPAGGASRGVTSPTPSASATRDDTELCRAYAADGSGYRRLRRAAGGGRRQVRRYCSGLLGRDGDSGWWSWDHHADDPRDGDGRDDTQQSERTGSGTGDAGSAGAADSGPGTGAAAGTGDDHADGPEQNTN